MTDKSSQDLTAISAQPMEVEIGGNKYQIGRPTLDDFGALEMKIKQDRMVMLASVLKASGEDRDFVANKMIEMLNSPLGQTAYREGLSSPKYLSHIIYLCLRRYNPDINETDIITSMSNEDLNNISSVLLGADSKNAKRAESKKADRPKNTK